MRDISGRFISTVGLAPVHYSALEKRWLRDFYNACSKVKAGEAFDTVLVSRYRLLESLFQGDLSICLALSFVR